MIESSPAIVPRPRFSNTKRNAGASRLNAYAAAAVVIAVALALWLPRLRGPIDLRFDAGVYYILGTSLATGEGYRILSEPGSLAAVQYPPMLPLWVAAHQWVLGTSDPTVVGPVLRGTFFVLFLAYALAVLALARRFISNGPAALAAVLCLLSVHTYFLSDLLFAEIPFALVSVLFALVGSAPASPRPGRRNAILFTLGTIAFFLRTAGLALFAAWVFDALVRRRWRDVLLRGGLALLPFALWQGYIMRVERSLEYQQPAYAYQRAPYLFYNVSYGKNIALKDPFAPELGRAGVSDVARRVATNALGIAQPLTEAATLQQGYWRRPIGRMQYRLFGSRTWAGPLAWVAVASSGLLLFSGIVLLFVRRAWLIGGLIVASVGLVCLTPWPGQFHRYLSPLTPFLTIALMLAVVTASSAANQRFARGRWLARLALGGLIATTLLAQTWVARRLFQVRAETGESFIWSERPGDRQLFFHGDDWRHWERAVQWLDTHAPADAIIATASPHLAYLVTGRHTVMPPMEADPTEARRLMEAVPLSYVIVDEFKFLDITRRYALPALESAPERWRLVHAVNATEIYAFDPTGERHQTVPRQGEPERPTDEPTEFDE